MSRIYLPALLSALLLALAALPSSAADTPPPPPVTVAITAPTAGAVVGSETVTITNHVVYPPDVAICAVETTVAEIGAPALTIPLSAEEWYAQYDGHSIDIPESWDTLPMHNGECRLTTRVVYQRGDQRLAIVSDPITVTVKNLWITKVTPATAFFTVNAGASQTVAVDFDHYRADGPYRVEYTFRMPQGNTDILKTVVHENVTTHHDTCVLTADEDPDSPLQWGAYVCFDIKVTCDNDGDAATLISPTCHIIQEEAEVSYEPLTASVTYALSESPSPGGLTILCFSNMKPLGSQEGLSDQCRGWDHPVIIPVIDAPSFRSVYVGLDNHTDNRGRAPQPIMPES